MVDGLEEFDTAAQVDALQESQRRLQRQLRAAKARAESLVEAVYQGAYDAALINGPIKAVPTVKVDRRRRKPEVALWDLGDWQGAKVTTSYNSEVMRKRVMQYCEVAQRITEIHRSDHPVKDATIVFGGDMVEGLFNFPTQPFEIDASLMGQFQNVSALLVDVVRYALSVYEKVNVVAEWGNHGRVGSKRDCVPRSDNVDRMCFHLARMLLAQETRLTWEDCPEDIQRLEIGNYRALVVHGDEIGRNGFASPMTIVNHVAKWQSGAYPWQFRDCYVHHYHTHQEFSLPNGLGSVYFAGSTESDNRYARDTMASSAIPSQRLHFIDPEAGRVTECRKIWLD